MTFLLKNIIIVYLLTLDLKGEKLIEYSIWFGINIKFNWKKNEGLFLGLISAVERGGCRGVFYAEFIIKYN